MRIRYEYHEIQNGSDDESLQSFLDEGGIGAFSVNQTYNQKCEFCDHVSFLFPSKKYGQIDQGKTHMATKLLMCASKRCKSAIHDDEGTNKLYKVMYQLLIKFFYRRMPNILEIETVSHHQRMGHERGSSRNSFASVQ